MADLEKEEYEKIRDESKTGFETTTDKGLVQTIEWNFLGHDSKTLERAKLEMTRRLKKEIQRFSETSSKQTKWIVRLTIAMLIVGIAQIGLFIYSLLT